MKLKEGMRVQISVDPSDSVYGILDDGPATVVQVSESLAKVEYDDGRTAVVDRVGDPRVKSLDSLTLDLNRFTRLLEVKAYADKHFDGDMPKALIALVNSGLSHEPPLLQACTPPPRGGR